eukprot:TRINITY_DN13475_c0_g1_i1.p2 TRINITY_DN13475_c0_g1~~TRINITY_DN13475_c0_g1_i1.p2  ORF type:complete len:203 (+),score=91.35 TRINITY_DN13475_c0_g1_i1:123-731(+)
MLGRTAVRLFAPTPACLFSRTTIKFPVGGPFKSNKAPKAFGPGKSWSITKSEQEGPAVKDTHDVTERGWVMKMLYMLQPITLGDLWEELFRAPFNPVHNRAQLRYIIRAMRKDMQCYIRLDPDDLQFYLYMYPQWARLAKNYIEAEKKIDQEENAKLASNPPPPYPADPLRYYHQYLEMQESYAQRRIEELKSSNTEAVHVV